MPNEITKAQRGLAKKTNLPNDNASLVNRICEANYYKYSKGYPRALVQAKYRSVYNLPSDASSAEVDKAYASDVKIFGDNLWKIITVITKEHYKNTRLLIKHLSQQYSINNKHNLDDLAFYLSLWIPFGGKTGPRPGAALASNSFPALPTLKVEGTEYGESISSTNYKDEREAIKAIRKFYGLNVHSEKDVKNIVLKKHPIIGMMLNYNHVFWNKLKVDLEDIPFYRREKLEILVGAEIERLKIARKEFSKFVNKPKEQDWDQLSIIVQSAVKLMNPFQYVGRGQDNNLNYTIKEVISWQSKFTFSDLMSVLSTASLALTVALLPFALPGAIIATIAVIDGIIEVGDYLARESLAIRNRQLDSFGEVYDTYRISGNAKGNSSLDTLFVVLALVGLKSDLIDAVRGWKSISKTKAWKKNAKNSKELFEANEEIEAIIKGTKRSEPDEVISTDRATENKLTTPDKRMTVSAPKYVPKKVGYNSYELSRRIIREQLTIYEHFKMKWESLKAKIKGKRKLTKEEKAARDQLKNALLGQGDAACALVRNLDTGEELVIIRHNIPRPRGRINDYPEGRHAEVMIKREVEALREKHNIKVEEIYSEIIPCPTCAALIKNNFPDTRVKYSFKKGVELQKARKQIFK